MTDRSKPPNGYSLVEAWGNHLDHAWRVCLKDCPSAHEEKEQAIAAAWRHRDKIAAEALREAADEIDVLQPRFSTLTWLRERAARLERDE